MLGKAFALLVAVAIGFLVGTLPQGVTPPFVPADSATHNVPPWAIFRVATKVHEWLAWSTQAATPPHVRALDMITAYWQSDVVYTLIHNGVFDAIPPQGASVATLAADLKLNEPFLARFFHAAVKLGLLDKHDSPNGVTYTLTPVSLPFTKAASFSLQPFALHLLEEGRDAFRATGTKSLKTGKSAFSELEGIEFWDWLGSHPLIGDRFHMAMMSLSRTMAGALISEWTPPASVGGVNATFCDIGGGVGTIASQWLQHHPHAKGMVFDQQSVMSSTTAYLKSQGLAARAKGVPGSFFEAMPAALKQCDVFFLKHVLHDWPDNSCASILQNIKAVAKPGAVVASMDFTLDHGGTNPQEITKALMNINMMAFCSPGAKERNAEEIQDLYKVAGLPVPKMVAMRELVSLAVSTLN